MARELQEYQMLVHLFGAISSPACANLSLRKTAEGNKDSFSLEVTNTVTSIRAKRHCACQQLTKRVSNSPMVNEAIYDSERLKEI